MNEESIAPISRVTFSLLAAALFLGALSPMWGAVPFFIGAMLFWLGAIQVLNRCAFSFSKPFNRLIHWIHAMSLEAMAILAATCLHPTLLFSSQRKRGGTLQGRPILLIHGYLHNSSGWIYQRHSLIQARLGPVYSLDLGYPFRSICDFAEKTKQKAEQIERETGRKDLILIGHSMGGLVSAWYATHLAPAGKVTDIIAIGSPFEGTHVARIALGPNGREMECDSEFLKKLREAIQKTPIRFHHIASQTDQIIVPQTSAFGSHPDRQLFVIEDLGHMGLLFSPRVARKICAWLTIAQRMEAFSPSIRI